MRVKGSFWKQDPTRRYAQTFCSIVLRSPSSEKLAKDNTNLMAGAQEAYRVTTTY